MTKGDLVEALFESGVTGDTRTGAERAVEAMLVALRWGLRRKRRVRIAGFGVLAVRKLRPRTARNPRTGERVALAARRTVSFKPADRLRSAVGDGEADGAAGAG